MDKSYEKDLQGFEEGPLVDMYQDFPRVKLKKVPNWKTSSQKGIRRFWFKNP